ncbi:MAG: TIGR01459 family HAD-type hydrolase, partial [Rhodospirillaceae bacterium]
DPFFAALGTTAYHLGPERDRSVFEDTRIKIVSEIDDADFVVNTGPVNLDDQVEDYVDVLRAAQALDQPMVCANPDLLVIRGGRPIVCAGAIARRYETMGGRVAYRGKPDPAVYKLAAEKLGFSDTSRLAVVGDALETDIKGAAAAGIASIWCTGGIHAEALGVTYGQPAEFARARDLAAAQGQSPAAIIPGFFWYAN